MGLFYFEFPQIGRHITASAVHYPHQKNRQSSEYTFNKSAVPHQEKTTISRSSVEKHFCYSSAKKRLPLKQKIHQPHLYCLKNTSNNSYIIQLIFTAKDFKQNKMNKQRINQGGQKMYTLLGKK